MAKILSIHSYRGGTGKSNLTANLAACLAAAGKRVAVVDTDVDATQPDLAGKVIVGPNFTCATDAPRDAKTPCQPDNVPDPEGHGTAVAGIIAATPNNGIGIAEKHHESVFRIFKRLHGRDKYGGGTGSGLTIAKKIVERHHGRIWLESSPGEGTAFYFTLEEEREGDVRA